MATKTKILYVDDEQINLSIFKINLGSQYDIITAKTGGQAFEILGEYKDIKVVVSDMRMPFISGVEFIYKAKEQYPDIKYFILSGYDITQEIQHAIDKGVILNYFKKPFNIIEIGLEIEKALN